MIQQDPRSLTHSKRMIESCLSSPLVKSFLAGSLSGTCSTILFQPLDLVKTRIQSPISLGHKPSGIFSVVVTVIRNEHVLGLWKGMVPSLSRTVPGIGVYFSSLHQMKNAFGSTDPSPWESMCMGALARSISGLSMLPFTVVKTRFESGQFNYKSVPQALVNIYTLEGFRGLFSGLSATLLRDAPFSGLYLMFYTQAKKAVKNDMKHIVDWCGTLIGLPQEEDPLHTRIEHPPKRNLGNVVAEPQAPLVHFLCGISAGCLASLVTQPADVVKTHMQLYPHRFASMRRVILYIYEKDGTKGFLRGVVPRTLRRSLMAAMAWTVYEQIMKSIGVT